MADYIHFSPDELKILKMQPAMFGPDTEDKSHND